MLAQAGTAGSRLPIADAFYCLLFELPSTVYYFIIIAAILSYHLAG
jgi:hypothetical protein